MQTTEENFSHVSADRTSSGVVWGAIFAGAAAAAALSLILLVLGAGLGFSTISPWPNSGISATTLGVSTIAWLILTQIVASGMGGYLAGRLRIKWATLHTDEVFFRDTAHGFLAWAVASILVAALIGTVMGKTVAGITSAGSSMATTALSAAAVGGAASAGSKDSGIEGIQKYLVDSLFRPVQQPESALSDTAMHSEAERIMVNSIHSANLPPQDAHYLAQVIAKRTGLSVAEAEKRVNDTFNVLHTAATDLENNARQAADKARKATAYSALWMFIALLSGAFVASFSATLGGRQRDGVVCVKSQD